MSSQFNAHLVAPAHLMDQVDIFLNIAQDSVDSEFDIDLDSEPDNCAPRFLQRTIPNLRVRTKSSSRRAGISSRGLAEVAAEVSRS